MSKTIIIMIRKILITIFKMNNIGLTHMGVSESSNVICAISAHKGGEAQLFQRYNYKLFLIGGG